MIRRNLLNFFDVYVQTGFLGSEMIFHWGGLQSANQRILLAHQPPRSFDLNKSFVI